MFVQFYTDFGQKKRCFCIKQRFFALYGVAGTKAAIYV